MKKLLNFTEAGQHLGVSRTTIKKWTELERDPLLTVPSPGSTRRLIKLVTLDRFFESLPESRAETQ